MKIRHPEKVNNPINPIKKKPIWIRTKISDTQNYFKTKEIINKKNSLLFSNLDLIHSGFFLIGLIGLLTFSGCLIFITFYYIDIFTTFTK